ncbi:MAG: GNAT family N-acetyltransferase [Omnitrophica WOR_2 bacterium]
MDNPTLFLGDRVRLIAEDPSTFGEAFARWSRDSEFSRLLDNAPAHLWSARQVKGWLEEDAEKDPPPEYFFAIHALDSQRLIGFAVLMQISWNNGDCMVAIGIGERELWGKGYGTDAMKLILRYAFNELNLHRVTLGVFEYNLRAIRSYEKVGFKVEGCIRKQLNREGKRWNLIHMGMLRTEWEQIQAAG